MATINQPFLPGSRSDTDPASNALTQLFSRVYTLNWEMILWTVLFVAALFTRFFELGQRVMSHDESLHTLYSYNLYRDGNFQHTPLMHGPILFHFTAFFYFLFGPSDFSARIYAAVAGVIIVMFPLLMRRWLGRWGSILASVMLLASPLMLFYARYIREDTPAILATLVMVYAIFMYLDGPENQRRRAHWLYVLAAAMLWNLGTKETAFIYVAVFGMFGLLYWLVRLGQVYLGWRGKPIFYGGMIGLLIGGVATLGMIVVISVSLGSRPTNETIGSLLGLTRQTNGEYLITLAERLQFLGNQMLTMARGGAVTNDFIAFLSWTGLVVVSTLSIAIPTALWAYRREETTLTIPDLLAIPVGLIIVLFVGSATTLGVGLIVGISFGLVYAALRLHNGSTASAAVYIAAVVAALIAYWLLTRLNILPPAAEGGAVFDRAALLVIGLFGIIAAGLGVSTLNSTRSVQLSFATRLTIILLVALVASGGLLIFEELSFEPSRSEETAAQPVPGEESVAIEEDGFSLIPIFLAYVFGGAGIGLVIFLKQRGFFEEWAELFPEFDVLMLMGSLILPWLTAVFIVATHGAPQDYIDIANRLPVIIRENLPLGDVNPGQELEMVGRFIIGFNAWLPMMTVAIVAGLAWNWRKWLIASAIFHILFAFFFTTIFTNIAGLATGMIYSLQYWLEQQGVRRGSQPQYYYLLVIMPFYEFLPVIGSVLAMFGGMVMFWRKHRERQETRRQTLDDLNALSLSDSPSAASFDAYPLSEPIEQEAERQADDDLTFSEEQPSRKLKRGERVAPEDRLSRFPFLLFVSFWGVMNLYAYTLAGEKMPWLGTHMTVPLIFLAAWYFGRIFDQLDVRRFVDRGWVYLFLLPLLFVTGFQIIAPYLGGRPPFLGQERIQLAWTYQWLAVVGISAVLIVVIIRLAERLGWRHLRHMFAVAAFSVLALLTFRSAWTAAFINYDLGTEFLVYAHGGPGNRIVVDQLEEISLQTTGAMDINFAYDDGMHWPGLWYFRDFNNRVGFGNNPTLQQIDAASVVVVAAEGLMQVQPLLQDRFQQFTYVRMYWPMQDYFDLSAQRINELFDLSPENATAGQIRRGVFDIWWARDYATFGEATGKTFDLTRWPLMDELHFFVRKDIAAQVWPLGTGEGSPLTAVEPQPQSACVTQWQQRSANLIFDTTTQPLVRPIGISVSADGQRVFVAEEGSHRISVFTTDGEYITSFGQQGTADNVGAFFERPHDVAAVQDGSLIVADFWNHRIRTFDAGFTSLNAWGEPMFAGAGAPREPLDGFYGPRDVLVAGDGTVYVSDTGNKRIRVFSQQGVWLRDIGTGGSGPGQLDEPVGLALHPDGRLFVADTWNRRISIFDAATGATLSSFTVDLWQSKPNNLPYLALDSTRDLLYVTNSDAGRILVYNTAGECVGAFGQFNFEAPNSSQFAAIGGIALDADGQLYVVDIATGRVLRFDPFQPTFAMGGEADQNADGGVINAVLEQIEITEDAPQDIPIEGEAGDEEATAESTPEAPR